MSPFYDYALPGFLVGVALGAIVGTIVLHRRLAGALRLQWIGGSLLAAVGAVALWSGPLGAADRFASVIEPFSRQVLDTMEMTQVKARLGRDPLARKLYLSGPGDAWQRSEIAKTMSNVPGVSIATWSASERSVPLVAQGMFIALAGIAFGWLLAGLLEWHRRYNAQWNW